MRACVIVFPGSNCDRDVKVALEAVSGQPVHMVWHGETSIPASDLIVLPGGFAFGDYLRCGAMAAHSPVMRDVVAKANPDNLRQEGRFTILGVVPDGQGGYLTKYGVTDESGKLNINGLIQQDPTGQVLFTALMMLPNMTEEVAAAMAYGANIIPAYEVHDNGMDAVLARIPDGGQYYITIDADGLDPSVMPAVEGPAPGGLTFHQVRKLIHGLVRKGRVVGMDIVEITPSTDVNMISCITAGRLIVNLIGAAVRANYFDAPPV